MAFRSCGSIVQVSERISQVEVQTAEGRVSVTRPRDCNVAQIATSVATAEHECSKKYGSARFEEDF